MSKEFNFLQGLNWGGNVRELENVMAQAVIGSSGKTELGQAFFLNKTDARYDKPARPPIKESAAPIGVELGFVADIALGLGIKRQEFLDLADRSFLELAVERTDGNKSQAAVIASTSRQALTAALLKYKRITSD